ncbi:MAG: glycosyltransferase [Buchananella hordeovulneris]|nr:glycosyltransferase [Buchananella hordeovulneris]
MAAAEPSSPPRVVAVVVAYNRRDLLQQTLDGLGGQTRALDAVVVVDNASTDDSGQVAAAHPVVTEVVSLPRNTGGAGGFTAGIARAMSRLGWERGPVDHTATDFVWLMDDDTIPTATALEELLAARSAYGGNPAVLASKAVWTDGTEHPMNRPRSRPFLDKALSAKATALGLRHVRTASFVSILIDARAIGAVGLPCAGYFLWNDDFEYTSALLRGRVGLYVPASVVVHATKVLGDSSADPGDRFEWEVRNKLWALRSSRTFNCLERAAYSGSTVLRWARTLRASADRPRLWAAAKRGLRDGIFPVPGATAVLAGTPVSTEIERWEGQDAPVAKVERYGRPSTATAAPALPAVSVLMSCYRADAPAHARAAIASITSGQHHRPDQLVVVVDGPVPPALLEAVRQAAKESEVASVIVRLERNVGLARALNAGLRYCEHEVVARQDADDVSLPARLETQLPLVAAGAELVGSAIAEFDTDPAQLGFVRELPQSHAEIRAMMASRSPFNHPSVVFTKRAVEEAGGYLHLDLMEDYWLFARMMAAGIRCANSPEVLVAYRVGEGAYGRRGGLRLLRSELRIQWRLRQLGLTSLSQATRNVVLRGCYRLVPTAIREPIYRLVVGR